jgi:hypothetical protein
MPAVPKINPNKPSHLTEIGRELKERHSFALKHPTAYFGQIGLKTPNGVTREWAEFRLGY